MDNIVIKTQNDYSVTLKPFLTYGQFLEIQNAMLAGMKINPGDQSFSEISGNVISESNKKALDLLIVSIEKDGQPFNGTVLDLPSQDGQTVMDKVNEITRSATLAKKKTS